MWFRDYVYIPLGGNRCSKGQQILNMLVVWALTGFWHGANWNFLCWGLYYFVLLVIEKYLLRGVLQKGRGWLCPAAAIFMAAINLRLSLAQEKAI